MTTGYIHSIETCGTVDGPGIRFIVFMQGCPLRCLYCHNPDCRQQAVGQVISVDELVQEIQQYRSYIRPPGGITISGGEPLMQPDFVRELCQRCQELGIHTAIDTSGYVPLKVAQDLLEWVDLVLLDIKSFEPDTYSKVTGVAIQPTLELAKYLSQIHKPMWVRFVMVPHLTDAVANMQGVAHFVAGLGNVERLEILPFHKTGEYKWQQLGYDYQLSETPTPKAAEIQAAVALFKQEAREQYEVIAI